MGERERLLVEEWRRQPPSGEFLYPECNFITLAYPARPSSSRG
nr:hypothetical protein [Candidatus Freyrarchaeum guaymaensis]